LIRSHVWGGRACEPFLLEKDQPSSHPFFQGERQTSAPTFNASCPLLFSFPGNLIGLLAYRASDFPPWDLVPLSEAVPEPSKVVFGGTGSPKSPLFLGAGSTRSPFFTAASFLFGKAFFLVLLERDTGFFFEKVSVPFFPNGKKNTGPPLVPLAGRLRALLHSCPFFSGKFGNPAEWLPLPLFYGPPLLALTSFTGPITLVIPRGRAFLASDFFFPRKVGPLCSVGTAGSFF